MFKTNAYIVSDSCCEIDGNSQIYNKMNPVFVPQFIATQNPCSIENLNYTALVRFSILILPLYFQGLSRFPYLLNCCQLN